MRTTHRPTGAEAARGADVAALILPAARSVEWIRVARLPRPSRTAHSLGPQVGTYLAMRPNR